MRSVDLRLGDAYVLAVGERRLRAVVLEIGARGRVRIRMESGLTAGTEREVLSRVLIGRWDGQPIAEKPARSARRYPVAGSRRPPRVGDQVVWSRTSTLVWTLTAVTPRTDEATISGEIFGQPSTRVVPFSELALASDEIEHRDAVASIVDVVGHDEPSPEVRLPAPAIDLSPEAPRRELEVLLENILFSETCLKAYGRRFAPDKKGEELLDKLREEIRLDGFVDRDVPSQSEYARIRVPHRFDVVLRAHPTADNPAFVTGLFFPRRTTLRRDASRARRPCRSRPGSNDA